METSTADITAISLAIIASLTTVISAVIQKKSVKKSDDSLSKRDNDLLELTSKIEGVTKTIDSRLAQFSTMLSTHKAECFKSRLADEDVNTIYNSLHILLNKFNFSVCYIMQPHPQKAAVWLSVKYEVRAEGVNSVKQEIREIPISDISHEYNQMVLSNFKVIYNSQDIDSSTIKGVFNRIGAKTVVTKKMQSKNVVTGFIVGTYNQLREIDADMYNLLESAFNNEAATLQDIIPEVE